MLNDILQEIKSENESFSSENDNLLEQHMRQEVCVGMVCMKAYFIS